MMIPHEIEKTKCLTNMEGGTNFTIKASSKMFRILSSGLYSNKIKAVVREVSCNAVDANVDAGNSETPILVHLPNENEPWFSIKDSGTGLTPTQMTDIYTSYGTSTKTDRNDQIGALGLGSKSPFSYVDQFTVTSVVDGTKWVYSAFLNGEGEPRLQPFGDAVETDEINGLEVSFPVKSQDFDDFAQEAKIIFRPFEVQPEIVGNSYCKIKGFNILLEGTDWQLVEDDAERRWQKDRIQVAVQGNIEYPINIDVIEKHLSGDAKKLLRENFRLMFPIGELDIAASREELGYDEMTINNIVKKFNIVAEEIADSVSAKLDTFTNRYKVMEYLADMRKETRFYDYFTYKWNGEEITSTVVINSTGEFYHYVKNANRRITRASFGHDSSDFSVPPSSANAIYILNDNNKKGQAVSKARYKAQYGENVYLLQTQSALDAIGNPEFINASEIDLPHAPGAKKAGKFFKAIRFNHYRLYDGNYEEASDVGLDLTKKFYYVEMLNGNLIKGDDIKSIRNLAVSLGYMKEEDSIFIVSASFSKTKKFKALDGIDFFDVMQGKLKRSRKINKIISAAKKKNELRAFENQVPSAYMNLIKKEDFISELDEDSGFVKVYNEWKIISDEVKEHGSNIELINDLRFFLDINSKLKFKETKVDTSWTKQYPLINNLGWSMNTDDVLEYVRALDFYRGAQDQKEVA